MSDLQKSIAKEARDMIVESCRLARKLDAELCPGATRYALLGVAEGTLAGALRAICHVQIRETGRVVGWKDLAEELFRKAVEQLEREHDLPVDGDPEGLAIVAQALASEEARGDVEREKGKP